MILMLTECIVFDDDLDNVNWNSEEINHVVLSASSPSCIALSSNA